MNNNSNIQGSKTLKLSRGLAAVNSILKNPIHNANQLKEQNSLSYNKEPNNHHNNEKKKPLVNKLKHQIESLNARSFLMNEEKKIDVLYFFNFNNIL